MAITQQESTLGFDPLDRPIWGVAAIAEIINRDERATQHLIRQGLIDVTQCGACTHPPHAGYSTRWVCGDGRVPRLQQDP